MAEREDGKRESKDTGGRREVAWMAGEHVQSCRRILRQSFKIEIF